jgi:hypothetical protein
MVTIDGNEVKAKIMHVGNGKFKILEDEYSRYIGKIVDASEVMHCKFG